MKEIKIGKGWSFKDGKLEKVSSPRSIAQRIRERKSKKVRVAKPGGLDAPEKGKQ